MAMAQPFFALEGGKGHAGLDLASFDLRRVSLVILDCIIVEMGTANRGASYETILRAVRPTLLAARPDCTESEADRVTSYALDALTNEREREAFRTQYQVQEQDGSMRWVSMRFKLVDVREGRTGDIVYFADTPAINFYLSSLEIDIEAEQAAKDGAHEYYMRRERYGDAGQNAEESLKTTILYREKLLRATSLLSRDIRSVNYVAEIAPTLNEAGEHIKTRMDKEAQHIKEVEERMDTAQGDPLLQLARIRQIFQKTEAFYTSLATEVIGLDRVYLDEQARQSFRPAGGLLGVGDPVRDLLNPALSSRAFDVYAWVEANTHCILPPAHPTIPALVDIVALLLQDPQQRIGGEVTTDDQTEELSPLIRFTPEDLAEAEELIDSIVEHALLSELLQRGRTKGVRPGALRHVVLRSLMSYEEGGPFVAERAGMLSDTEFHGNDLLIRRTAE